MRFSVKILRLMLPFVIVLPTMEGEKRQYSMHTSLFLYVGNFILFCKLCHYIM